MSITEFFKNNFDYFWDKYCFGKKAGYKILGPEEIGADTTFLIFWATNLDNNIRVMIIFYLLGDSYAPIIITSIKGDRLINNNIIKKMPVRLKNNRKKISNFYFTDTELLDLANGPDALHVVMNQKILDLNESSFEKIAASLRCKGGQESRAQTRSVYAIPSGLYGLGKNRKH